MHSDKAFATLSLFQHLWNTGGGSEIGVLCFISSFLMIEEKPLPKIDNFLACNTVLLILILFQISMSNEKMYFLLLFANDFHGSISLSLISNLDMRYGTLAFKPFASNTLTISCPAFTTVPGFHSIAFSCFKNILMLGSRFQVACSKKAYLFRKLD